MKTPTIMIALALASSACSKEEPRQREVPTVSHERETPSPPLPKERPTVDPKSSEAAENLVRGFVRLLNEGRLNDAYMLLGPKAPPRAEFDQRFTDLRNMSALAGSAGAQDGAAGSIYVSVPMTLSGRAEGEEVRRKGNVVLRRVNDVPGSTEAQRRWHIERIDWIDH